MLDVEGDDDIRVCLDSRGYYMPVDRIRQEDARMGFSCPTTRLPRTC